jgi:hypothetical protein
MAKQGKKFEGIKAITPTFRASFLNVFEPKAYEDGEPKFSVDMLFHKKKSDLKEFRKKMKDAGALAWGTDEKEWPKNFTWPVNDGDERDDKNAAYAGHVSVRADSKNPPGIYDQNKEDIMDKREIYSGCFCKASVFMVPYENIGGKFPKGRSGIKLYLQGIQLVKKGDPLGNVGSRNDFEVIENEDGEESSDESESEDGGGF